MIKYSFKINKQNLNNFNKLTCLFYENNLSKISFKMFCEKNKRLMSNRKTNTLRIVSKLDNPERIDKNSENVNNIISEDDITKKLNERKGKRNEDFKVNKKDILESNKLDNPVQITNQSNLLDSEVNLSKEPSNIKAEKDLWRRFFTRSARTLPNINRSIKNIPDSDFFEFFDDMKNYFNEKQFLFLVKNIYLNTSVSLNTQHFSKISEILKVFVNKCLYDNSINFNSKVNLIMLMEGLYVNTARYQSFSLLDSVKKASNYLRIFYKIFTIEEKIFTLVALNRINCYDYFLCDFLLKNHDILKSIDSNYIINYFKTPVRMDLCIINLLCNHILYNQSTKQKFLDNKLKDLIKNVLNTVEEKIKLDLLPISILGEEYKNLNRLYNVFDFDEKRAYEKKMNNVILEKSIKLLELYLQENEINRDILIYTSLTEILKEMKPNTFDSSLFDKCFQQICFLIYQSFISENYNNLSTIDKELTSDLFLKITKVYKIWIKDLCQVSFENNIFNPYLYKMFLINFNHYLSVNNYDLIKIFSFFNFSDFVKNHEVEPIYIKCYYSILEKLISDKCEVLNLLKLGQKNLSDELNDFDESITYISNSNNFYETLHGIYSKFTNFSSSKQIYNENDLHYNKEVTFLENITHFINRFQSKININLCPTYHNDVFNNTPSNNLQFDAICGHHIFLMNWNIEIILSLISQKICTQEYIKNFLSVLDDLVSNKHYQNILQNYILNNKNYLQKLMIVLNYILKPDVYNLSSQEEFNNFFAIHKRNEISEEVNSYNKISINNHNVKFSESLKNITSEPTLNHILEFQISEDEKYLINDEAIKMDINALKEKIKSLYIDPNSDVKITPYFYTSLVDNESKIIPDKYFGLSRILMDVTKIAQTIDTFIMKNDSNQLKLFLDNHYKLSSDTVNLEIPKDDENMKFSENCRNFSLLKVEDILSSNTLIDFVNEYLDYEVNFTNLKKLNNETKVYSNFSVFPFIADYAINENDDQIIDALLLNDLNNQFKFSKIINPKHEFKINYMKSQFKTIYLLSE